MAATKRATLDGDGGAHASSYYGQPVIKEPVWTPEIPLYFFAGGLGGASAGLAFLAEQRGNERLARAAWASALAGVGVSPPLLISDLGRSTRFLNMLRMFKITSPMSVGSWILSAAGLTTGISALSALTGRYRLAGLIAKPAAALLGLPLSTYTAVLIAQTAVPVWHEARRELPVIFAAGAAASAGAATTILTDPEHAGAARRLAVIGSVGELLAVPAMEHRLGELGQPYHEQAAGRYARLARVLTVAGTVAVASSGRRRAAGIAGGALILAGALSERWSIFRAGFQSAREPRYTVAPQRERVEQGQGLGASHNGRSPQASIEQAP